MKRTCQLTLHSRGGFVKIISLFPRYFVFTLWRPILGKTWKIKMAQCGIVVVSSFTYKIQKCPRTQCTFIRQTLARVGSFGISRLEIRCSMFSSDKPLTFNTLVHFSTLWYISGTPYHTLVHSGTIWYTLIHSHTALCTLVHLSTLWYTRVFFDTLSYTQALRRLEIKWRNAA